MSARTIAPPNMGDYFWDGKKQWPCQQPPWGRLIAVNVNTGNIAWQVPLGSFAELDKLGVPKTGTPTTNGGGIATAGGLVFIGASIDGKFRAFDSRTGKELWVYGSRSGHELYPDYLAREEWQAIPCRLCRRRRAQRGEARHPVRLCVTLRTQNLRHWPKRSGQGVPPA